MRVFALTLIAASLLAGTGGAQVARQPIGVLTAPEMLAHAKLVVDSYQLPCSEVSGVPVYDDRHFQIMCASGQLYAMIIEGQTPYAVPWVSPDHLFDLRADAAAVAVASARADASARSGTPQPVSGEIGQATAPPPERASAVSTVELTALAVRAREILDASLLDFQSARFREVRAVRAYRRSGGRATGTPWVAFCGQVNAKNRAGGYGGWTTFYVAPDAPDGTLFGLQGDGGIGGIFATSKCLLDPPERISERDFTPDFQP